ncbi:hypothetical protein OPQ81_003980 [Rhizoctonia solani]|nr:hypothetical protein OPQ81_003980 [Rhizoctonia solani]
MAIITHHVARKSKPNEVVVGPVPPPPPANPQIEPIETQLQTNVPVPHDVLGQPVQNVATQGDPVGEPAEPAEVVEIVINGPPQHTSPLHCSLFGLHLGN